MFPRPLQEPSILPAHLRKLARPDGDRKELPAFSVPEEFAAKASRLSSEAAEFQPSALSPEAQEFQPVRLQ